MKKNATSYEFFNAKLLNSMIEKKNYSAAIQYAHDLENLRNNLPYHRELKLLEEVKDCQTIIVNLILSLEDKMLSDQLTLTMFDKTDIFPELYEATCAKLVEDKTPEETMELYKIIKNQCFYQPSHTLLKHISSNTKKADTCLFFTKDLEESYKKYGNHEYDDHILDFYKRFRAVCSKEEYEQFVESGMQEEGDLQKQ